MNKYEQCILKELPHLIEVEGHHEKAPFWLTGEMFPEVKIRIAAKDCSKLVNKPHADPHRHDVPEIYMAITEYPGDMKLEICIEDETYVVESPCTVFIPAGASHSFKVLKCDKPNYMLGVFLDYISEE